MIEHLGKDIYARFNGTEIVLSKSHDGVRVSDTIALTPVLFAHLIHFHRQLQARFPTKYVIVLGEDDL